MMTLEWQYTTRGLDGDKPVRTNWLAHCGCGEKVGFVDLHDNRGPLRWAVTSVGVDGRIHGKRMDFIVCDDILDEP